MEGRCIAHGKIYTQKEVYMKGSAYRKSYTRGYTHTMRRYTRRGSYVLTYMQETYR